MDCEHEGPIEIALVGDLTDNESELCDKLLSVEPGGECVIYVDSLGGSPYCAMALASLIRLRDLRATGIVAGRMLVGGVVAVCGLRPPLRHALQRAAVSSHEVAERRERGAGGSGRMGAAFRQPGIRHGSLAGRAVRGPLRIDREMGPSGPLRQRPGNGGGGPGGDAPLSAAGVLAAEDAAEFEAVTGNQRSAFSDQLSA